MNSKKLPAELFEDSAQTALSGMPDEAPAALSIQPKPSPQAQPDAASLSHTAASVPVQIPAAQYYLCTVTDHSYLVKVIAQYLSLFKTGDDFQIAVCCTDDESLRILTALNLPRLTPVTLAQLGRNELYTLRRERKANEFCWTLKSYIMLYLTETCGLPHVLYCDGDVGFMQSLSQIYDDWHGSSVYLCTQRDVDWVEAKYGKYQAGIVGVSNNETGLSMLKWWRDKCREWCYNFEDGGRLGDQKYLDAVPDLFPDVNISWHRGIDAAPWNTVYNNNCTIFASGNRVTIDGALLVAYHFASLNIYDAAHYDLWHLGYITIQPAVLKNVYWPYLKLLREAMSVIKTAAPEAMPADEGFDEAKTPFIFSKRNAELLDWDGKYAFCTVASRTYVARTLVLYWSIRRHLSGFRLWICCADDTAYDILSKFDLVNTTLLRAAKIETPEISATRAGKSIAEYCWTLKSALCSYVLSHYNVSRLLYCDSDICFFSHPRLIFELWNDYATLLSRQLGTAELENKHGIYQAGLIGFSKAADSLEILRWWQHQCTGWCYDDHSRDDRWGDQKYLQQIPNLFRNIRVNDKISHVAAPWNIVMNNVRNLQVNQTDGDVTIGDDMLVAYHFGSINMLSEASFDLWKHEPLSFDSHILKHIYTPYLKRLNSAVRAIAAKGFDTSMLFTDAKTVYNPFSISAAKEADDEL